MRHRWLSAVLTATPCLAACNKVFGLEPADRTDAAVDAAVDADPSMDASLGTWDTPTMIPNLSTANIEEDPTMSSDGLELYVAYLATASPTGYDIVLSRRVATNQPWPPPVRVTELSSMTADWTPRIAANGMTIYLASDRTGMAGGFDVWYSLRSSSVAAWSLPARINEPAVNTPSNDRALMYCLGGTRAIFASDRNGMQLDLFELVNGDASVIPVAASMTQTETAPWVSEDCLTVYFTGDLTVAADFDLYVMTRSAIDQPFSPPVRIEELSNAGTQESDPWVSADQRHILFVANRSGTLDIWEAVR